VGGSRRIPEPSRRFDSAVRVVAAGYAAVEGNCCKQLPIRQLGLKINNYYRKTQVRKPQLRARFLRKEGAISAILDRFSSGMPCIFQWFQRQTSSQTS